MNLARSIAACGLIALSLLAPSCASSGFQDIQVETDANPKTNFDGFKTYAWAAAAAVVRDPDSEWVLPELNVGAEVMFLANREFRERGMSEVAESPDLLVIYGLGVDMQAMDINVDPESGMETLEKAPKGAVVLIVTDPETLQVVWAGSAKADLMEEPSLELGKQRLDYAITEMFKQSPF